MRSSKQDVEVRSDPLIASIGKLWTEEVGEVVGAHAEGIVVVDAEVSDQADCAGHISRNGAASTVEIEPRPGGAVKIGIAAEDFDFRVILGGSLDAQQQAEQPD